MPPSPLEIISGVSAAHHAQPIVLVRDHAILDVALPAVSGAPGPTYRLRIDEVGHAAVVRELEPTLLPACCPPSAHQLRQAPSACSGRKPSPFRSRKAGACRSCGRPATAPRAPFWLPDSALLVPRAQALAGYSMNMASSPHVTVFGKLAREGGTHLRKSGRTRFSGSFALRYPYAVAFHPGCRAGTGTALSDNA